MISRHYILYRFILIFPLILLFGGNKLFGQIRLNKNTGDFPYELKAPQEMGLMITGTGLLYASVIGHANKPGWGYTPISKLDKSGLNIIDKPATNNWRPELNRLREFFEPTVSIAALGAIGTHGILSHKNTGNWSELATLSFMYFEGLYIATGGELLAKALINRARPYTYNEDLPIDQRTRPGNNESFPSGNATIMFYNASFLSLIAWDLYPNAAWTPYLIGGSFALAELSAIWSVRSGMHFPTDILAGAIWGSGTALLINRLHRKGAKGLNIMPWMIDKGKGIVIRYILE